MDKLQKLQLEPKPTTAKLWYGNGELRLESNGAVAGVEITFRGKPTINWDLPACWTASMGSRKAILYSMDTEPLPEILGSYTGYLRVLSVLVANWDAEKVPTTINIENVHLSEQLKILSEDLTKKSEDLNRGWTS